MAEGNLPIRQPIGGVGVTLIQAKIILAATAPRKAYTAQILKKFKVVAGVLTLDAIVALKTTDQLYNYDWEGASGTAFLVPGNIVTARKVGAVYIVIDGHPRGYL